MWITAAAVREISRTEWYGALVILVLLSAFAISWALRTWNAVKGETEGPTDTPERLIGPLEEAYASGQMSEEEYRRIRDSVEKVAPVKGGLMSPISPVPRDLPPVDDD